MRSGRDWAERLTRAVKRVVGRSGPVLDGRYHHRSRFDGWRREAVGRLPETTGA